MIGKNRSTKVVLFSICISIMLLILVLGCTAPAASTQTTAKPTTTSGPQLGGILKIGFIISPVTLGFPASTSYQYQDEIISRAAVEHLARYDATGIEQPWLAESWQTDAKAKTLTVKLKKGIKFHDGSDFNAEAVKWNWGQWRDNKRPDVALISSIDVIDDYTVRVTLSNWDSDIIFNLCVYAGGMISPTAYKANGAEWCAKNPVGTGPFQFVSMQKDVNVIYKKFPDYWQKGKPYLDGMEWKIISNLTTLQVAFEAGEIDIALSLGIPEIKAIDAKGKYQILSLKNGMGAQLCEIAGDSAHSDSPFADIKVRQATGHAIDKTAIVTSILSGYGTAVDQWVPNSYFGYNPNVKGYPYNPEKAKQLLIDAGYAGGFSTTLYASNAGDFPAAASAVQAMLVKVGINTKVELLPLLTQRSTLQGGWKGLFMFSPRSLPGPLAMVSAFHTSSGYNAVSTLRNEKIDSLLKQAKDAATNDARKQTMMNLWAAMFDEYCVSTPLFIVQRVGAKYPKVNNDGFYITESSESTPEDTWIKQ